MKVAKRLWTTCGGFVSAAAVAAGGSIRGYVRRGGRPGFNTADGIIYQTDVHTSIIINPPIRTKACRISGAKDEAIG